MIATTQDIVNVLKINRVKVSLLKGVIVKIEPCENIEMGVQDILDIQNCKKQLLGEKPHLVLFIAPQMGVMTKEARELASSEEVNKNAIAKAIVLGNLGMRIMSNFFIKINRPKAEHKIFQSEREAIKWLLKKGNLETEGF